jgi:hypothetical protein
MLAADSGGVNAPQFLNRSAFWSAAMREIMLASGSMGAIPSATAMQLDQGSTLGTLDNFGFNGFERSF